MNRDSVKVLLSTFGKIEGLFPGTDPGMSLEYATLSLREGEKIAVPEFMAAEAGVLEIAYKDGALSTRIKRLFALAIALKVG